MKIKNCINENCIIEKDLYREQKKMHVKTIFNNITTS